MNKQTAAGVIDNQSDVKIKHCELNLMKKVTFRAQGRTESTHTKVHAVTQPGMDKSDVAKWSNVKVFVPCLPPSNLDGCSLIDVQYHLHIRIVPPGVHFALDLDFPINIGTIPFNDMMPWAPPPQGTGSYAPQPAGSGGYAPPGSYPAPPGAGRSYVPPPQGGAGYAPPCSDVGPSGFVVVGDEPLVPAPDPSAPPPFGAAARDPSAPPSYSATEAGPLPSKSDMMGGNAPPYSAPGASAPPFGAPVGAPPPPFGAAGPGGASTPPPPPTTYGGFCSDSSQLPSYEELFQVKGYQHVARPFNWDIIIIIIIIKGF
eukprot:sb/3466968/